MQQFKNVINNYVLS